MIKMRSKKSIVVLREMLRYINASNKTMAEIGCYAGEATKVFSVWCKKVYAIDPWEDIYIDGKLRYPNKMGEVESAFDEMCKDVVNIVKIKTTSSVAVRKVKNKELDFVYIDGLHTRDSVKEDIRLWYPKIKPGGWICGHDYTDKHSEVRDAVNEAIGLPQKVFREGSWVVMV